MAFLIKFFAFILAWGFIKGSIRKDAIFFLQKSSEEKNEILLVMTWTENEGDMTAGCEIFTNEGLINEILASNHSQIRTLPEYEMQILLGDCLEFNHQRRKRDIDIVASTSVSAEGAEHDYDNLSNTNKRRTNRRRGSRNRTSNRKRKKQGSKSNATITSTVSSTTISLNEMQKEHDKRNREKESRSRTSSNNEVERKSDEPLDTALTTEPSTTVSYDVVPIIFPGTKWCGHGAIAKNYDDLGKYADTDRCCRAHDLCDDYLSPGETRNNLTNKSPFTKLCCRCDEEFYNCLEKVYSVPANTIGNLFFNILRRDCYTLDHPRICKKYLTIFKLTCTEYEKDTSKEKIYQWVHLKKFPRI